MWPENGTYEKRRLKELLTLEYGESLPDDDRAGGSFPVLDSNGVVGFHNEAIVSGPGIVIGRKGSIGQVTWVEENFWPIDTTYYVAQKTSHDKRWLYYLLQQLGLDRLNSATGVPGLNRDDAYALHAPVPTESQSQKIAHILRAIDNVIEETRAVIEQTRRLKSALLQDLLTNGPPGRHKKFKETKSLGRIPADWEVVRLDEIATVERGKFTHRPRNDPRFYGGNIPFVQTGDIVASGDYLREHSQTLNEHGLSVSRIFPKGTILFAIAASVGATTITPYDVAFPDSIVGITPHSGIQSLFLLRVLQTAKSRVIRTATESAQANISLELLCPIPFALPPSEEREAIATVLRVVEERLEQTQIQLNQLHRVKVALSQGLLTGRIRVDRKGCP